MKKNVKEKIVLVGGCFDILHDSHIEFLKRSKALGDTLIVLLESDENVKKLKGKDRPINSFSKRLDNLSSTGLVDIIMPHSTEISEQNYNEIVNSISPDIIAITKGDPLTETKKKQAKMVGGKVEIVMDRDPKNSTTLLIK